MFPKPSCSLLDLIPVTTTSVCLHTQVFLAAWLQASILLQVYLNYHVLLQRFLTVNTVCQLYILHVVQPANITLQVFLLSAARFLTVNSGRRFFNQTPTPSVLLSSTSERPSTAKTTQHPDPSIDPQVEPSHPSPHPSFPLCSSDLMPRSKYWSASGPSLLRSPPSPRLPHGFNHNISKTSLLYRLSLICF